LPRDTLFSQARQEMSRVFSSRISKRGNPVSKGISKPRITQMTTDVSQEISAANSWGAHAPSSATGRICRGERAALRALAHCSPMQSRRLQQVVERHPEGLPSRVRLRCVRRRAPNTARAARALPQTSYQLVAACPR